MTTSKENRICRLAYLTEASTITMSQANFIANTYPILTIPEQKKLYRHIVDNGFFFKWDIDYPTMMRPTVWDKYDRSPETEMYQKELAFFFSNKHLRGTIVFKNGEEEKSTLRLWNVTNSKTEMPDKLKLKGVTSKARTFKTLDELYKYLDEILPEFNEKIRANVDSFKYADYFNPSLKVLNFTHVDLDGCGASIVLKNYYKNVVSKRINYNHTEGQCLQFAKDNMDRFDVIIFTDFTPRETMDHFKALNIPILIIDHHESAAIFNDHEKDIYIDTEFCGAKETLLFYKDYIGEATYNRLLDFVDCVNDFDMWILEDERSMMLNAMFFDKKMGWDRFERRFITGNMEFTQNEIFWMQAREESVKKEIENLRFKEVKGDGAVIQTPVHFAEISRYIETNKNYNFLIMWSGLLDRADKPQKVSVRIYNDRLNFVKCAEEVGKGGGHEKAGGFQCDSRKEAMDTIAKYIDNLNQQLDDTFNADL